MSATSMQRTNIIIDKALLSEASEILGTEQMTATVHAALREVVDRAARRRLAEHDFGGMTLADLNEIRSGL